MQYKKIIAGTPVTLLFDPPIFVFEDFIPIHDISKVVNKKGTLPPAVTAEIDGINPLSTSLTFRNLVFDDWIKFEQSSSDYKTKFLVALSRERNDFIVDFHNKITSLTTVQLFREYPAICFMNVTDYLRSYCDL